MQVAILWNLNSIILSIIITDVLYVQHQCRNLIRPSEDVNSSASIYLNSLLDTTHYVDDLLYYSHNVAAIIGIPFNLLLIGIIVVFRRLRLARNFTWIGTGHSNIFILTNEIMLDVSVRWKARPWFGRLYFGLPFCLMLLNLLDCF